MIWKRYFYYGKSLRVEYRQVGFRMDIIEYWFLKFKNKYLFLYLILGFFIDKIEYIFY